MTALIRPRCFSGIVRVPASKSHAVRMLIIAAQAEGVSEIERPPDSLDARSCVSVCRAMGAEITERRSPDSASPNPADEKGEKLSGWTVRGLNQGGADPFGVPVFCDAGNSGTTLFLALAAASLGGRPVQFDGDEQLRRRSAAPLLEALSGLGVSVKSSAGGRAPVTVRGPWKGGRVSLPCPTSQYLSALLLAAPLAPAGTVTEIDVPLLNEKPYIGMTLSYLNNRGFPYRAASDFSYFHIPGGGAWKPVNRPVPGDFSSAAFPAAAAVISGGSVILPGLDPADTQGDKAFFGFLEKMGCLVKWEKNADAGKESGGAAEWRLGVSRHGPLKGGEFDLNATPDLLPAMAALACYAQGDTALLNVGHARIKETDRIAAMSGELEKLGVKTTEYSDGLVIHGLGGIPERARNAGGSIRLDGHQDHRVVMALACAALGCPLPVEIAGAEYADVTYPGFMELLGADSL